MGMRRGAGGDLVGHPEEAQVLILGLSVTSHLQELRAHQSLHAKMAQPVG